jgi:sulfur transfer protein SufE
LVEYAAHRLIGNDYALADRQVDDADCWYWLAEDSMIMKGILEVLASYYSGLCPLLIVRTHDQLTNNLDLSQILSSNRRNGTANALNRIKELALEVSKRRGETAPSE